MTQDSGSLIQICKQIFPNQENDQLEYYVDAAKSRTICNRRQDLESNECQSSTHADDASVAEIPANSTTAVDMETQANIEQDSEPELPCRKKKRLDPGISAASVLLQFATSAVKSSKPDDEISQHSVHLHSMQSDKAKRVERVIALPHEPPQVLYFSLKA